MNVEDERFEEWEAAFNEIAEGVPEVPASPQLSEAKYLLCLYGENGFTPDEEFAELDYLRQHHGELKKVLVDRDYWQDVILFLP